MSNTVLLIMLMLSVALTGGCASHPVSSVQPDPAADPVPNHASAGPTADGQTTAAALSSPVSAPRANDYRIGAQDLLEIQVFGVAELSRTVRVNSRGFISLPLIGQVQAAGLTNEELEAGIAQRLVKDYLQDPQVTVFIKEYTSQRVTVEGAVKKPGIYPLKGRTTLMQAIALAEGLGEYADDGDIRLFRTQPSGTRVALQFSLDAIRSGGSVDPPIQDDDVVVVPTDTTKTVIKGVTDTLRGFVRPFILVP